jgi:hypothetical protein
MVNRQRGRSALFAASIVIALAALYGAAGLRHPVAAAESGPTSSGQATVSTSVRACAAPGSTGATAASLAIAAVPGADVTGSAVATRLTPAGSLGTGPVVATLARPGVLQISAVRAAPFIPKNLQAGQPGSSPSVRTEPGRGGVLVTASGAMAQGLEVEQTGPGGLVTAQCGSPGTNFWFVGPGQASSADMELYLMNTGNQPADAAIGLVTDDTKGGPLLGNADNGITVPPHAMVEQSLSDLLQASRVVAVDVSTSVGQVVAALRESDSAGEDGNWLPATQAPARNLVIPGLPSSSRTPQLYVAVPGTATAQVKLSVVTTRGSYQPTGGTGIDLLGGSAVDIPLSSLTGVSGAVTISSTAPVVASMLMAGGPSGTPGVVAASAGPVQEQGVVADNPVGSTDLILSAPEKAATVRITEATSSVSAVGQAGKVVEIKAGTTDVIPVRLTFRGRASQFAIVVTPLAGSGPVYAGRVISVGGVVQSILPVPSSPTWLQLPAVQESLTAIER